MQDLLQVVERSADNLLLVEDFIARESLGEDGGAGPDRPAARRRLSATCTRLPPPRPTSLLGTKGPSSMRDEDPFQRLALRPR